MLLTDDWVPTSTHSLSNGDKNDIHNELRKTWSRSSWNRDFGSLHRLFGGVQRIYRGVKLSLQGANHAAFLVKKSAKKNDIRREIHKNGLDRFVHANGANLTSSLPLAIACTDDATIDFTRTSE
jgi:hypothetical protein